MKYICFEGHEVPQGVPICPKCGSTTSLVETVDPPTELMTLQEREAVLLKWLQNIQITNIEERKNCSDLLTNARRAQKDAKAKLKELLEPSETIKEKFKPYLDKLDNGIKLVLAAMSAWDFEQERLARESMEVTEQFNPGTGEIYDIITMPVPMPIKTTQSHVGSDTQRDSFDIVIDNPDEVERIFCDPSLVKLRAGFKIYDSIKGAHKVPKKVYQTRKY